MTKTLVYCIAIAGLWIATASGGEPTTATGKPGSL